MKRVHVLAVGDFGVAVAQALRTTQDLDVVVTPSSGGPVLPIGSAFWPVADVRVLASWRETPALAEQLDDRSAAWRTPWLPVVLEHPLLRVGPVVVPGAGACYRCFRARARQHEPAAAFRAVEALHAHYDSHPDAGPSGYLPHHVTLAASLAVRALAGLVAAPAAQAGRLRSFHLLDHQPVSARVVAVHGCSRCRRRTAPDATWGDLAGDLAAAGYGRTRPERAPAPAGRG